MHRKKSFRARVLVPSALAVAVLSGAVAPASAADGGAGAALTRRVEAVQEQIEGIEARAAAGPIDDLFATLRTTLEGLLKSLEGLLPAGVKLPPIQLPTLPALPEIPTVPQVPVEVPKLPEIPAVPAVPAAPAVPALPAVPAVPALPVNLVPDIPEIPDVP
ncbi:hypothetical protein [Streptomyces sp. NPDC055005]